MALRVSLGLGDKLYFFLPVLHPYSEISSTNSLASVGIRCQAAAGQDSFVTTVELAETYGVAPGQDTLVHPLRRCSVECAPLFAHGRRPFSGDTSPLFFLPADPGIR